MTRPVGEKKEVTLTATISYGDESATKEFIATVMPVYERQTCVEVKAGRSWRIVKIHFHLFQNGRRYV